ncbi:MAG: protocatechuate 3,4-dioxygenase subunit beta, partial [Terriglobia bacterium]
MSNVTPYKRHDASMDATSLYPPYRSTVLRAPRQPLIFLPHTLSEITGPVYGHRDVSESDPDLTRQHAGEPLGERIIVTGRVLDDGGGPIPHTLVEIWQANAAGRYFHQKDDHHAPLDLNFTGAGRVLTDESGCYKFVTVKPGA